ncbi:MAG: head-tail connector protein [Alphaproteobacteria bacterium]
MLTPVRIAAPTDAPVTLAQAKAQVHAEDFEDDDVYLRGLIAAATQHVDGRHYPLLMPQAWRFTFDRFCDSLRFPKAPIRAITSVAYYDGQGADQTLPDTTYVLREDDCGPYLALKPSQSWPSTYSREDAIRIEADAGYANVGDVPDDIKQALLLLIGHWYANRQEVVTGTIAVQLPMAVETLLSRHRRYV